MDAVISGRAGVGILLGSEPRCLNEAGEIRSVPKAATPLLVGDYPDLRALEGIELDEIRADLNFEIACDDSLHLALLLSDPTTHEDIRRDAASALDDLLQQHGVSRSLESILYARPLPASGDLNGAVDVCEKIEARTAGKLLTNLRERQNHATDVYMAWEAIPEDAFPSAADRAFFEREAIYAGLFRDLVIAIITSQIGDFLIEALSNPELKGIRETRDVLLRWTKPFRSSRSRNFEELTEEEWQDIGSREHDKRPRRISRHEQKATVARVKLQKEAIKEALRAKDLVRATQFITDLKKDQLAHGGGRFLTKSLCDIAMEAKKLGLYSLQLELTAQAVEVRAGDGWAWCQYGDALLIQNKPTAALEAFRHGQTLGAATAGATGQAQVAKFKGELKEALALYDRILAGDPEDVVAKNGRAEVLKSLNRLHEALAAYDAIIAAYPEDVIAKSGRAEVLKSLNRLDEALAAYDAIIAAYPEDVIPRNGHAEVLKSLNRLDEALATYDAIIAAYPEDVIAKNGRAETLKSLNRLDEALAAYDAIVAAYPEEIIAKSGRAEVLKSLNRLDEALAAYDAIIAAYPENVIAKSGRAEVLKSLNRLDEALAAYDAIVVAYPEDIIAKSGRAEVLKSLNRLNEALAVYDAIIAAYPEDIVSKTGRADTLKTLGRFNEAIEAFDAILAEFPHDQFSRAGRYSTLVLLGDYAQVLAETSNLEPVTPGDWIMYHIRGVALMLSELLDEATSLFEHGVQDDPQPASRAYFCTGLAVARIRLREYDRAVDAVKGLQSLQLYVPTAILRIHAHGELGHRQQAMGVYTTLQQIPLRSDLENLVFELHARYLNGNAPRYPSDWLVTQESRMLLTT